MSILYIIILIVVSFFAAIIIYGVYLGYKDFQENKIEYLVEDLIKNAKPAEPWMLNTGKVDDADFREKYDDREDLLFHYTELISFTATKNPEEREMLSEYSEMKYVDKKDEYWVRVPFRSPNMSAYYLCQYKYKGGNETDRNAYEVVDRCVDLLDKWDTEKDL